jgi:hypothetical protein
MSSATVQVNQPHHRWLVPVAVSAGVAVHVYRAARVGVREGHGQPD